MTSRKIRAFLDTNVLLAYFRGKAELQDLFSEKVRERAAFSINSIVLQELLLSQDNGMDLTKVVPYLEVVNVAIDPSSPETKATLRDTRNRALHVNDILILFGARSCDVLLTYDDRKLRTAGKGAVVRSETPEEFLDELGVAA